MRNNVSAGFSGLRLPCSSFRVDEVALCGPKERIRQWLAEWKESGITSLPCTTNRVETLRMIAELAADEEILRPRFLRHAEAHSHPPPPRAQR